MRLLIFSLLLTVVYSWEDIVDNLRFLIYKRKHRNHNFKPFYSGVDNQVSVILLFFAIPLTIIYFLSHSGTLVFNLGLLTIELLTIALLGTGITIFNQRLHLMQKYHGMEKVGVLVFAGIGLVSPTFRLFYRHAHSSAELMSKFALYLSLPVLAGWLLARFTPHNVSIDEVLPNINSLIVVAVGGLIILITVKFLEEHLRLYKFSLLPYTRILLGIILLFILSEGLI